MRVVVHATAQFIQSWQLVGLHSTSNDHDVKTRMLQCSRLFLEYPNKLLNNIYPWRPGVVGLLRQMNLPRWVPIDLCHPRCAAMTTSTGLSILWYCPSMIYDVFLCDDYHPLYHHSKCIEIKTNPEFQFNSLFVAHWKTFYITFNNFWWQMGSS